MRFTGPGAVPLHHTSARLGGHSVGRLYPLSPPTAPRHSRPMAVLLTVGITFIGSANCYRQRVHMNMTVRTDCCRRRCATLRCSSAKLFDGRSHFEFHRRIRDLVNCRARPPRAVQVDQVPSLSVGITFLCRSRLRHTMLLLFIIKDTPDHGPPPRDGPERQRPGQETVPWMSPRSPAQHVLVLHDQHADRLRPGALLHIISTLWIELAGGRRVMQQFSAASARSRC